MQAQAMTYERERDVARSPEPASSADAPAPVVAPAPATAPTFRLTPPAARKVAEALQKRGTPKSALRVGVRGGGCSGFSYVIEFADGAPAARDLVFTFPVEGRDEPVRVYCDKKSILYLNGGTLDWEKTLMYQGFKFKNPHEKSSCGCSSSFSV
ncbi:MAG: iron-sulfur cluster assembly accessory protein [Myxococcales bacterium]|nr:iron-sulfur cluster assembly accessory protein [Myxococcales bacterium]